MLVGLTLSRHVFPSTLLNSGNVKAIDVKLILFTSHIRCQGCASESGGLEDFTIDGNCRLGLTDRHQRSTEAF